jgi:hypothetical protein
MSPTEHDPFGEWDPIFEDQLHQLLDDAEEDNRQTEEQSTHQRPGPHTLLPPESKRN